VVENEIERLAAHDTYAGTSWADYEPAVPGAVVAVSASAGPERVPKVHAVEPYITANRYAGHSNIVKERRRRGIRIEPDACRDPLSRGDRNS
jgi:hypothetical protein